MNSGFNFSGVGQSEFAVADMVDMFILLLPPAGGDELQVLFCFSFEVLPRTRRRNLNPSSICLCKKSISVVFCKLHSCYVSLFSVLPNIAWLISDFFFFTQILELLGCTILILSE